jgi:hypothetical protein
MRDIVPRSNCMASKTATIRVVDYIKGKNLGTVSGHGAYLPVEFDGSLLVEVLPR